MRNKLIAAAMLMLLALGSAPVAFAAVNVARLLSSQEQAKRSSSPDHSCCPGFHASMLMPLFVALTPVPQMPCGDRHPCCAKQRPESSPALAASPRLYSPDAHGIATDTADQSASKKPAAIAARSHASLSPPSSRSTVLRI
jgi:hypothetical protein